MPFVPADWSIDRQTRNIRYIGDDHTGTSPSYATVIEFHRALQDFADDAGYSGNDELDITDPTPSDRSTDNIVTLINGWNIDDNAAEHIYDGSIIQDGGNTVYDGIKILAPTGTVVQIIQNGTVLSDDWWNTGVAQTGSHTGGNNASILTDSGKSWTTNQWVGYRILNTTDGSFADITANDATTITGTLQGGTDNDWDTGDNYIIVKGLNDDAANGVSHNFMLKVTNGGSDIDGRRLVATTRQWGRTFLEFKINGTTRGINVVALAAQTDLNNQTSAATIATYSDITNQNEGYVGIDVNNDGTNEFYYSRWTRGSRTINQLYERLKYLTRDGSTSTLYGINGELFRGITHEIPLGGGSPSGTFNAFEAVSWSGGTGRMLAINNTTASSATKMWIQLLTGVKPTNGQVITGGTSGATVSVNGSVIDRTISTPFVGVSTGSAIIGGYGVGILASDLTKDDKLFDLTNTQYSPPNIVTFTVSGLVSGEDRVLVSPLGYRFAYDNEASGPFQVGEILTFTSPAGTARLAELYDNGTTGFMYISEMLTGSVPTDNSGITGGTSGATASVNGAVTADTNLRQLVLQTALTGASVTSVVVTTPIPTDTPSSGTIRIERNDGQYTRHPYSSWSGSTFTLTSATDFSGNNASAGNNVFISYIDKLADSSSASFSGVYTADRNLFIRVRDGGGSPIKTFETTGTLTSAGGSTTAIRTPDV
jgi:hypothetical protein